MDVDLLIAIVGSALVLAAALLGLRFIYDYRISNHAIEGVLFHVLPVYRLPFERIEVIRKVSWKELGIGGVVLRLGNRIRGECVLIQKRSGLLRRVVITPNDADGFINQVSVGQQRHPT